MQALKTIDSAMYKYWELKDCDFEAVHSHMDFFVDHFRVSPKLRSLPSRKYVTLRFVLFKEKARLERRENYVLCFCG